jgi:hypothetical protein
MRLLLRYLARLYQVLEYMPEEQGIQYQLSKQIVARFPTEC